MQLKMQFLGYVRKDPQQDKQVNLLKKKKYSNLTLKKKRKEKKKKPLKYDGKI